MSHFQTWNNLLLHSGGGDHHQESSSNFNSSYSSKFDSFGSNSSSLALQQNLLLDDLNVNIDENRCRCEFDVLAANNTYQLFNYVVIVVGFPSVAAFGVLGNLVSFLVYTRAPMRHVSMHCYLAALAVSDALVNLTGTCVVWLDSARSYQGLDQVYLRFVTYLVPLSYIAQMCSIYCTVLAATDCYLHVCWPRFRMQINQSHIAVRVLAVAILLCILYNVITYGELFVRKCVDPASGQHKLELCPTELRENIYYLTIYRLYMYAIFMSLLPFLVLLTLNSLIIHRLWALNKLRKISNASINNVNSNKNKFISIENDSTIMLVTVVALFLFCNSISLVINIIEATADNTVNNSTNNDQLKADDQITKMMYLIDTSNFLVIFNSSANFLIYITFCRCFRNLLRSYMHRFADIFCSCCCYGRSKKSKQKNKTAAKRKKAIVISNSFAILSLISNKRRSSSTNTKAADRSAESAIEISITTTTAVQQSSSRSSDNNVPDNTKSPPITLLHKSIKPRKAERNSCANDSNENNHQMLDLQLKQQQSEEITVVEEQYNSNYKETDKLLTNKQSSGNFMKKRTTKSTAAQNHNHKPPQMVVNNNSRSYQIKESAKQLIQKTCDVCMLHEYFERKEQSSDLLFSFIDDSPRTVLPNNNIENNHNDNKSCTTVKNNTTVPPFEITANKSSKL